MSIRFATVAVAAGLAAALAFLPWGFVTQPALASGEPVASWITLVSHAVAGFCFLLAGFLATRGRVVRPWLAGPLAGFVAASLAAWLVWLPVVHATSLDVLWSVVRAGEPLGADAAPLIGPATNALLVQGTLGFWALGLAGAFAGLVGTALAHGSRQPHRGTVRNPILWPIRLWMWTTVLVVGGFIVLHQSEFDIIWVEANDHGWINPSQLFMINGALLGFLVAAPFGAALSRFARSGRVTLRRLAVRGYGLLGILGLGAWWGILPVMAPELVGPTPAFIAYALAPLLGVGLGALIVRHDPEPPIPRAADVWWEMMPLALLTGPMVVGPGLGGVAWAALVGPLVWKPYLAAAPAEWPSLSATLSEVMLFPAAVWAILVIVPMVEVLMVFLPVLVALRQGAVRQFVKLADEVRESHTQPRLKAVTLSPKPEDIETELRTPPVTG
ncbi:MAG: hypothetical protein AAGA48_35760 [Myxococcota bacterium]